MDITAFKICSSCWIGSLVLYFKLKSDEKKVIEFLPHFNAAWRHSTFIKIVDFFLFTIIGTIVVMITFNPTTPTQAFFQGIGWTAVFSAISKDAQ